VNERKKDKKELIFYIHSLEYACKKLGIRKGEAKRIEGYLIMELISSNPTIQQF
jgi:hypothetical protein